MPKQKLYYGWFIVAACFAVMATLGETFLAFGVFFKPLESEFGWSRTMVSSAFTVFIIGYSISLILSGQLSDRYSPRLPLLSAGIIAGLGFSLCSQIQSIHELRFFLFIAGLGSGATLAVPSAIVQRWFYGRPHAGAALGIVTSGVGVGGLIFAPLINHLILTQGWRQSYVIAGIIFTTTICISALVIRQSPHRQISAKKEGGSPNTSHWTIRGALTSPGFVAIVFLGCAGLFVFQTITVHLVPHVTDLGITPTTAAAALGLMSGFSIPGRLLSGFLSDRIGWKRVMVLSFFGLASAFVVLLFLKANWMLYGFVFLFGLFHGLRFVAGLGIIGHFFGMRSIGALTGILIAVSNLAGSSAPYIAGFIFDTTGSYQIDFIISLSILLAGALVAIMLKGRQQ